MSKPTLDEAFDDWKEREALAERMIPIIGKLYRKNIATYIHGEPLYNRSVIELMKAHRFVRQIEQNEMSEFETWPVVEGLSKLDLGPVHIDIGKLNVGEPCAASKHAVRGKRARGWEGAHPGHRQGRPRRALWGRRPVFLLWIYARI